MSTDITIGYWGGEFYPDLPMPIPDTALPDQKEVIAKLKAAMTSGYMTHYRGSSNCRLCGKSNGYRELEIIRGKVKYRIPEGYVHYLEEHRVGYDPQLIHALE